MGCIKLWNNIVIIDYYYPLVIFLYLSSNIYPLIVSKNRCLAAPSNRRAVRRKQLSHAHALDNELRKTKIYSCMHNYKNY